MNTCAECRFWKTVDVTTRMFERNPDRWGEQGSWRECTRERDDEPAKFFIATIGADDQALMTRSDFGCVQFEPLHPEVTIEKPGFFKTTFRTAKSP